MRKLLLFFVFLLVLPAFAFDLRVVNYFDETYGDYIPPNAETIAYNNSYFFVVADLEVSTGDELKLQVNFPDGSVVNYSETASQTGEVIFFKKIGLRGIGEYLISLEHNGDTKQTSVNIVPDNSEDAFEPDNFKSNGFTLERGGIYSSLTGMDDVDYYRLKVERDGEFILSTESKRDIALVLMDENGNVITQSDKEFDGNEEINIHIESGDYLVKIYSRVIERGDYTLCLQGNFPVYLPLSDFNRGFSKKVVVSNIGDSSGDVELKWYSLEGNLEKDETIHLNSYQSVEIEGGDYSLLKAYSDSIPVNACVYGHNDDRSEAIAYEGSMVKTKSLIVSHIAPQTNLYETIACFSFLSSGTFLNLSDDNLTGSAAENSTFLINFNDFYQNNIQTQWGVVTSDAYIKGVEMFRLITEDYRQATALSLSSGLSRVIFLPHIDVRYFWWTGISIVNPWQVPATVTLLAFDLNGNIVGQTSFTIEAMGKSVGIVSDYFDQGLPENTVSMKIVSTLPVQGLYLFGTKRGDEYSEDIFAGLNSSPVYARVLYFAVLPSSDTLWSGVGLFNPSKEKASVILKGFTSDGTEVAEKTISLDSYNKYVSLGKDIFNRSDVYRMVAISDKPLCGFYLFGDRSHTYLYGMEALR